MSKIIPGFSRYTVDERGRVVSHYSRPDWQVSRSCRACNRAAQARRRATRSAA